MEPKPTFCAFAIESMPYRKIRRLTYDASSFDRGEGVEERRLKSGDDAGTAMIDTVNWNARS